MKLITDPTKEVGFNQIADLKRQADPALKQLGKHTPRAPHIKTPHVPSYRHPRIHGFPTAMRAQMNRGRFR